MTEERIRPFNQPHWQDPRSAGDLPELELIIARANMDRKKPVVGQKRPFYMDEIPDGHAPTDLNGCIIEITRVDDQGNVTCKFDLTDPRVKEVHDNVGLETYTAGIRYLFNEPK